MCNTDNYSFYILFLVIGEEIQIETYDVQLEWC